MCHLVDRSHQRVRLRAGEALFRAGSQGQGAFLLTGGIVALRRQDHHGDMVIVRLVTPGQTLGLPSTLCKSRYASTAVAVTDVEACRIDPATVRTVLDQDPRLGMALMQRLATDLLAAEEAFAMLATRSARERVLWFMMRLLAVCGARPLRPGGLPQMRLPLSRHECAAALGLRPESLSRALAAIEGEGLMRFAGRHVQIQDLEAIQRILGQEPDSHRQIWLEDAGPAANTI